MNPKVDGPILSPVRGKRLWQVVEPYGPVPAGFTFDGASVPRLFWRIVTPGDPRVIRAAMLHDFAYRNLRWVQTRKLADQNFRRMLIGDGVSPAVAHAMYWAVRLGGGGAWEPRPPGQDTPPQ